MQDILRDQEAPGNRGRFRSLSPSLTEEEEEEELEKHTVYGWVKVNDAWSIVSYPEDGSLPSSDSERPITRLKIDLELIPHTQSSSSSLPPRIHSSR